VKLPPRSRREPSSIPRNYHSSLRDVPKERGSQLYYGVEIKNTNFVVAHYTRRQREDEVNEGLTWRKERVAERKEDRHMKWILKTRDDMTENACGNA
jgi:hypothetical protein